MSVISLLLLIPSTLLFLECVLSLFRSVEEKLDKQDYYPRIVVLVPAHNEALCIEATLQSILPQLVPQDQLIVIADNCTDNTVSIAKGLGVKVIERFDTSHRGKGYALDFGLKALVTSPPEIVVMIDADCQVDPGVIRKIACKAFSISRPVQAAYSMLILENSNSKNLLSAFAFKVKNIVRPNGLCRLSMPVQLVGTGMAFPWFVLGSISTASCNIVEDMQLGIDLAIAGYPAVFCPTAHVYGFLPLQMQAAQQQRTRWEHGHLQTLFTQTPRLLKEAFLQKRLDLLVMALDLAIPPISLLVVLLFSNFVVALSIFSRNNSWLPLLILLIDVCLVLLALFIAWLNYGRDILKPRDIFIIPLYVLWKIPLYLRFLVKPEVQWIKTQRDKK